MTSDFVPSELSQFFCDPRFILIIVECSGMMMRESSTKLLQESVELVELLGSQGGILIVTKTYIGTDCDKTILGVWKYDIISPEVHSNL